MRLFFLLLLSSVTQLQTSCFQVKAKHPVVYQFEPGRTALLKDG
jgi:hypothetical protein